jgi:hypothetical protein
MPAPIIIEVTPQAKAVIAKLRNFPQQMGQAIKRGMDDAGNIAWSEIDRQRFSGKGPFPPLLHKLGQVSERTKQGLMWKPARIETTGNNVAVTGSLGVYGVWYFALHEVGATIKPHFRRSRAKNPKRLMIPVRGYSLPARAPLRTGIEDHKILFQQKIQQELEKELAKK